MSNNDGGPAFPNATTEAVFIEALGRYDYRLGPPSGGMSLRDWFAGQCQADDRLVKCVRSMDDKALEIFALHPDVEREERITEIDLTDWMALQSEVAKVARRLELEARAIARVRYMQADAMLKERGK